MLRHNDITEDAEIVANAHRFKRLLEKICHCRSRNAGLSPITTERHKVEVSRLLITNQLVCHAEFYRWTVEIG